MSQDKMICAALGTYLLFPMVAFGYVSPEGSWVLNGAFVHLVIVLSAGK